MSPVGPHPALGGDLAASPGCACSRGCSHPGCPWVTRWVSGPFAHCWRSPQVTRPPIVGWQEQGTALRLIRRCLMPVAAPSHRDAWRHPAVLVHPPCPRAWSLWQEQRRGRGAWGRLCHRHRLPCGAGIHHPAAPDLFISRRFWCDNVPHLAARALSHRARSRCPDNVQRRCQCCCEEGGWVLGSPKPFLGRCCSTSELGEL